MKEIEQCAHMHKPKNKLSRCRSEAWGFCHGKHKRKTWCCHEHLVQCPCCGHVFCGDCLPKHRQSRGQFPEQFEESLGITEADMESMR